MTEEELKSEFASLMFSHIVFPDVSEFDAAFDDVLSLFRSYLFQEPGCTSIAELKKEFIDETGDILATDLMNSVVGTFLDEHSVSEVFNWLEKKSRVISDLNQHFEKAYNHAMTVLDNLIEETKRGMGVSLYKAFLKMGSLSDSRFKSHKLVGLRIAKMTIENEMREFHIGEEILIEHPEAIQASTKSQGR